MKIKNIKQYSYWRKREQAAHAQRAKSDAEIEKEIRSIYAEMADGIQKEIDSFYAKYAAENGITIAEAQRRASTLDMEEYERKAEKYVREKTFTQQANREMRLYNMTMKVNRLELLKSKIGLELLKGHSELERTLGERLAQGVQREFERLGGILGETVKNATKRAEGLVGASFKNARFSDRIWMSQDLLKAELAKMLRQGLIQGKSSIELARNLRKIMDVSQSNAERLMRTEMTRVQIEAQKLSYKANDFDKYMYIALSREQAKPGQRACDICEQLDGQVFDVKDMEPGLNAPPMHPNCRCSTASAFMDPQEFDRWLDEQVDEMNGAPPRNEARGSNPFNVKDQKPWHQITPEDIEENLKTSEIGRRALKYMEENNIKPTLNYGLASTAARGVEEGGVITIHMQNIGSTQVAAQTVLHELAHKYYDIGDSQWAEAKCMYYEKMHLVDRPLTFAEKRYIVGLAKEAYFNFKWRRGGWIRGKRKK